MKALGIDVSSHQGNSLDFPRIEEAGYSFVILRHSVGTSKDMSYDRNLSEIKKTGLMVGAYHYVWASASVSDQLDAFLQHNFSDMDLPPVLDIEQENITESNVLLFLKEIERLTGRVPMIYTRKNIWENIVSPINRDKYKKYFLWVAQHTDPVGEYPTAIPSTWSSYDFWQFTSVGRIPGHPGNIDVNVYNGDLETLCCRFRYPKPSLKWPVDSNVITQKFGNNFAYYSQFGLPGHEGLDHRGIIGANVYAISDGVVYANYFDGAYGRQIRLDHQNGIKSTYAHLEKSLVSVGQRVTAGQKIGEVGNTGNSSGSHLHLTLYSENATALRLTSYPNDIINPTPYLQPITIQPTTLLRPIASVTLNLNIRSTPEVVVGNVVGQLAPTGTIQGYPVVGAEWWKVRYNNADAYMKSEFLGVAEQAVLLRSTAQPYVNIRSEPTTNSTDIGNLNFNDTIMGYPKIGESFWRVNYQDSDAWIFAEWLVIV